MVEESAMAAMDMGSSETNAGAGLSYSKTNLQEAGVDEADVVKTDGKYLYVMKATGSVRLIRAEDKALQTEGTIMLDALNETGNVRGRRHAEPDRDRKQDYAEQ